MLSFFRRGIMAKIALGVLFLTTVAMVITGFGTGGSGGLGELAGRLGSDTVAKAGGQAITTEQVRDTTQQQLDRMRQEQPELDMATFLRKGALEDIVDQMIDIAAATAFGEKMGLAATKRMVDAQIVKIPAFQGVTGQFDQNAFRAALANQKMTEAQLHEQIRPRLMQQQLVTPAAQSAPVPQTLAMQYA